MTTDQKRKVFAHACEAETLSGSAFEIDDDVLREGIGLSENQLEEARQYIKRNLEIIRRTAASEYGDYIDRLERGAPELGRPPKRVRVMHCPLCGKTYDTRYKYCRSCAVELQPTTRSVSP